MAYQAWSGAGSIFSMAVVSTFTPIYGVDAATGVKVNIPDKALVNVTALSDTAGKSVAGIAQPGDVTLVIFWDPTDTNHAAIFTNSLATNVNLNFKLIASNATGSAITFSGAFAGFSPDISGAKGSSVALKIILSTGLTIVP